MRKQLSSDQLFLLMLSQLYEEIQQLRQQLATDKKEILIAIHEHGTDTRANKG